MMKAYKSPDGRLTIVDTGDSMYVRIPGMKEGIAYLVVTKEGGNVREFEELHDGMTFEQIFAFVDEKIPTNENIQS